MSNIKFEVDLELVFEMAQCIYCCSWVSEDEVYEYMKGCITGSDSYDPGEWKNKTSNEVVIEQETTK